MQLFLFLAQKINSVVTTSNRKKEKKLTQQSIENFLFTIKFLDVKNCPTFL